MIGILIVPTENLCPRAVFSFGPAQSRMNEQSNKSLLKLVLE